ncbi:MFS transporter [Oceanospirillum maris]|jgi:YNFM family putative membrane transporter|uniref:MFS transporter n=1 Tax=Oceanospirillum maris TaxID=64977 RepID=UPI00041CBF65|nr:MFS transporter [Oceanospirillum maris]
MSQPLNNAIQRHQTTFWQASLALFAGAFVTFANLYSTQALLPLLAREFAISPTAASLSLSVATASLAVALLLTPGLSDRVGRKSVMVTALITASLLGFVVTFVQHYSLLLIIRGLQGFALAGLASIAMTYVNEEFSQECRGLAMGLYVSGTTVGGMSGRILTGSLTELYNWHLALQVLAAISLVFSLIFAFALPASRHFSPQSLSLQVIIRGFTYHLSHRPQLGRFLHGFLLMGGLVTLYNYVSFRLQAEPYRLSEAAIGWLFVIYLLGTFSSTWLGAKADRFGPRPVLLFCLLLMLIGVLLSLFEGLWLIITAMGLFTFGFFGAHSIVSSWVGQASSEYKAQASALYLLFYYAGSSLIGAIGGYFWSHWQWVGITGLVLSLVMISAVIALTSNSDIK